MKQNKLYTYNRLSFVVILLGIFITGCEDPSSSEEIDNSANNTLDQASLGGKEGEVLSYFYNFTQDISSKFLYYPNKNKISNLSTMDPLTDTLNLRTFSEYLLSVSRDDFIYQSTRVPFDEIEDSLDINNDGIYSQDTIVNLNYSETILWDAKYYPISHYKWNDEGNARYKQERQKDLVTIQDTLIYSQIESFGSTYDSLIFKSVIDSNVTSISELTFVDLDEFTKQVVKIPTGAQITISDTINYEQRYIEETSLLKLKSADCNDDGKITIEEDRANSSDECLNSIYLEDALGGFCDKGNGKYDDSEVYLDLNSNDICDGKIYEGAWKDGAEPFQDRNCNNKFDEAESRASSSDECVNSIYIEDSDGGFCDKGNGIWDAEEWPDLPYSDTDIVFLNSDPSGTSYMDTLRSSWEPNDPFFKITSRLDNLIVDYKDNNDPKALEEVYYEVADISLTDNLITIKPNSIVIKVGTETGWNYLETSSLLSSQQVMKVKSETFKEIERYETTYANVVVEQTESYCLNSNYTTKEECESAQFNWLTTGEEEEYFIMKSKWSESDSSLYDYHAFRNRANGDVVKLFHPFYFKHYGYIDEDIWYDNNVYEEVFLYTQGGILREGEFIYHDTLIVTPTGDYNIRTEYQVETDTITVPYTLWEMINGQIVCKNDHSVVDKFMQCTPGSDAFINDCFKITRTRTITLIGNGVEYGQRNTEWFSQDMGIVKSLQERRWSEAIWDQGEKWTKISLWELMDLNISGNSSRGLSRLLSDRIKYIDPKKLNQLDEFDREPYLPTPLFGFHRLKFHE